MTECDSCKSSNGLFVHSIWGSWGVIYSMYFICLIVVLVSEAVERRRETWKFSRALCTVAYQEVTYIHWI